jgi:hypothetical protein
MTGWLLLAAALAAPDAPLVREEAPIKSSQRYMKVDLGPPAIARWRNSKGTYEVWAFRDGQVEHFRRWDGRKLAEERFFDAVGDAFVTVAWAEGAPTEVTVHGLGGDRVVDTKTWTDTALPGLTLRAPSPELGADGTLAARTSEGVFRAAIGPEADVRSDAFRDGLAETCGCRVVDRATAFVDGRTGVRYLVELPDPDAPAVGEIWAVPVPAGTLVATWTAAAPASPAELSMRLATGRAILALAHWEQKKKK